MPLHYMSGQVIQKGDRILYAGDPGEVEFVADHGATDDEATSSWSATSWYLKEFGPCCMIKTVKGASILTHSTEEDELLEFVARRTSD